MIDHSAHEPAPSPPPAELAPPIEPATRSTPRPLHACPHCGAVYRTNVRACSLDGHAVVVSGTDPNIGASVGSYRIVELVGTGAAGRVYRAVHAERAETYAVKVPYGEIASNPTSAQRFVSEGETLAALDHPGILSVVERGRTEPGLPYLVTEFVSGPTLATVLEEQGALPAARCASIARQIASGLVHAHSRGVVHRDIKPSNIMLIPGPTGERVKILDFGISCAVERDETSSALTTGDRVLGTPIYMAPEQLTSSIVTPAADLYALGVVLHHMISGRPPFTGTLTEVLIQHCTRPPPALPHAGALGRLAARLMSKAPDERPSNAAWVVSALERAAPSKAEIAPSPRASRSLGNEHSTSALARVELYGTATATGLSPATQGGATLVDPWVPWGVACHPEHWPTPEAASGCAGLV